MLESFDIGCQPLESMAEWLDKLGLRLEPEPIYPRGICSPDSREGVS